MPLHVLSSDVDLSYVPRSLQAQAIQSVERFFKSAIVDKSTSISSASLVSAYHLFPTAGPIIKRWSSEASEALTPKSSSLYSASSQIVQSSSHITQYHALGLLWSIRAGDRMAVTKMVQQLSGGKGGNAASVLRSPMAVCMLIRMAAKVLDEDPKCVLLGTSALPLASLGSADATPLRLAASTSRCLTCSRAGSGTSRTWSTSRRPAPSARCAMSPSRSSTDLSRVRHAWPELPTNSPLPV
jgi:hypothetical protein